MPPKWASAWPPWVAARPGWSGAPLAWAPWRWRLPRAAATRLLLLLLVLVLVIVAVGPGARDESGKVNALELKAGDRILFGKWSGTEVKIDGEDLIIMKESDVLGVLS